MAYATVEDMMDLTVETVERAAIDLLTSTESVHG